MVVFSYMEQGCNMVITCAFTIFSAMIYQCICLYVIKVHTLIASQNSLSNQQLSLLEIFTNNVPSKDNQWRSVLILPQHQYPYDELHLHQPYTCCNVWRVINKNIYISTYNYMHIFVLIYSSIPNNITITHSLHSYLEHVNISILKITILPTENTYVLFKQHIYLIQVVDVSTAKLKSEVIEPISFFHTIKAIRPREQILEPYMNILHGNK